MSVRSCLLCGRALSRWSGSGDDFCSREHRNQYRLRRSMDRLQEANKVASVMRRRETPRPLKASRLVNGGSQEPRAFLESKTIAARQPASLPPLAPACEARLVATTEPAAVAARVAGRGSHSVCPAPLPVRSTAPAPMRLRLPVHEPAPQSAPPITALPKGAPAAQTRRKLMVGTWRSGARPVVDGILRRVHPPRVYPMAEKARAGALGAATAAACKGRALRVSLAAGFRIPEWKLPPVTFPAPAAAGMVWPGLHALQRRPYGPAAVDVAAITPGLEPTQPEMRIPAAPPPDFQGLFRWPGARQLTVSFANPPVLHRAAFVPFSSSEEYPGKERSYEYRN